MSLKPDRFEEGYLKGELTINTKALAAGVVVVLILILGAAIAAHMRRVQMEQALSNKIEPFLAAEKEEIIRQVRAVSTCKLFANAFCDDQGSTREFINYIRQNWGFSEIGFTARIIFRHKNGNYFYGGPEDIEYHDIGWEMQYFKPCIDELLDKGTCKLAEEKERGQAFYAFKPIRDPKSSKIIAVVLGRMGEEKFRMFDD